MRAAPRMKLRLSTEVRWKSVISSFTSYSSCRSPERLARSVVLVGRRPRRVSNTGAVPATSPPGTWLRSPAATLRTALASSADESSKMRPMLLQLLPLLGAESSTGTPMLSSEPSRGELGRPIAVTVMLATHFTYAHVVLSSFLCLVDEGQIGGSHARPEVAEVRARAWTTAEPSPSAPRIRDVLPARTRLDRRTCSPCA